MTTGNGSNGFCRADGDMTLHALHDISSTRGAISYLPGPEGHTRARFESYAPRQCAATNSRQRGDEDKH